jgi:sialic acid synthase SpsE
MLKRDSFRRSIVAAKDIPAGKIIEQNDLELKRPGTGLAPEYMEFIIGRTAKRDIKYDEILRKEDI